MSFSVLTNPQAASALLNLNKTVRSQNQVQERINTGLKVGKAKDDAATFSIALGMKSDVGGFKAIQENLNLGKSTLGVASSAANEIATQISSIKNKVVQASNLESGRGEIQLAISDAIENIRRFTGSAQFNGINLIDGSSSNLGNSFDVVSSLNRNSDGSLSLSKINVAYEDLSVDNAGRGLSAIAGIDVSEGKATETLTTEDSPVSVAIDVSGAETVGSGAAFKGDTVTFNYVDADGKAEAITFTAVTGTTTSNFEFTVNSTLTSAAVASSIATKLGNLSTGAGELANLGFTYAYSAAGAVTITRDNVPGQGGEIASVSVGSANSDITAADVTLTQSNSGVQEAQLAFNKTLDAGDTIDITFNDGTNDHTFQFVVSGEGEGRVSGSAVAGSNNTQFYLAYEQVVANGGVDKTTSEIAEHVNAIFSSSVAASVGSTGFATQVKSQVGVTAAAIFGDASVAAFSVSFQNNVVTLRDNLQSITNTEKLVGFNMGSTTGGSLDFDYMLQQLDEAEGVLKSVTARLGATESALETQSSYMEVLVNTVSDGIGTLIDANMAEESARFQALQVQQQLGLQALSIANQAPQSILSLFQ